MLNSPQGIKKMTRKIKLSIAWHGVFIARKINKSDQFRRDSFRSF